MNELTEAEKTLFYDLRGEIIKLADEQVKKISKFPPKVDVSDFVNHIDYLIKKIGINHVGISSDFDDGCGAEGWNDASETFNVTLELVKRGYSEAQIEQLWSVNVLRVLDEVQIIAQNRFKN